MFAYVNPSMHNIVYTFIDIHIEIKCAHCHIVSVNLNWCTWFNVYLVCNVSIFVVM